MNNENALRKLLTFLDRLEREGMAYDLIHVRETIMVRVDVPGERWEVEFFDNGDVEVEVFRSPGDIWGEEAIDQLFAKHGD